MKNKAGLIFPLVFSITTASYILPDSLVLRHCLGPDCPSISLPTLKGEFSGSPTAVKCESGKNVFVADPTDCKTFFACRNGTALKLECTLGYAFHPRLKLCVPETLVKSCGRIFCPPTVLVGLMPDPKNCTRYYRCIYGIPIHYQCEYGYVYDEDLGRCRDSGESYPSCLAGSGSSAVSAGSSESTEAPEIPSTPVPSIPVTESNSSNSTSVQEDLATTESEVVTNSTQSGPVDNATTESASVTNSTQSVQPEQFSTVKQ